MALLQYDISVVGAKDVERVLAGIERRFIAHNRKMSRMLGGGTTPKRTSAGAEARVAAAAQRRVHGERMRQISQEERARIRSEQRVHREQLRNHARLVRNQRRADERARRQFRGQVFSKARASMGTVGRYGMMAASLGGGMAMAGALEAERNVDKQARGLAIQGARAGFGTREKNYKRVRGVARRLGVQGYDPQGAIRGMRAYQERTGDFDGAIGLSNEFAKLALTSDADPGDIGATAGEFAMALDAAGMKGKGKREALKRLMRNMTAGGAIGSIEAKDMAKIGSQIGASTSRYSGMDAETRIRQAMAFAQLAKTGGASSPEEAATSLMRLSDDLVKNKKALRSMGIDGGVYDDKGNQVGIKDPAQVISEVLKASGGDVGKMMDVFGIRSAKVAESVIRQAQNKGVSVSDLLAKYTKATVTDDQLNKEAAFALEGPDARMSAAMAKFNEKLGPKVAKLMNKLLPSVEKLFPLFEQGADQLARFVDWMADNPLKGIGVVVAAAVAKDVASAAIGNAIKQALGVTSTGPPGTPGSNSKLANTMVAASAVAAAWGLAFEQWETLASEVGASGGSLRAVWKSAMMQLEDIAPRNAKMQEERHNMAKDLNTPHLETENTALYSSPLGGLAEMFGFDMTPDRYRINDDGTRTQVSSVDVSDNALGKMAAEAQAALTKAAQELSGAANKLSTATPQTTGGTGIPNRSASPTAP